MTHLQVKKWLRGQPMQEGSDVMTEIMAGEGAIQSANSVSRRATARGRKGLLEEVAPAEASRPVLRPSSSLTWTRLKRPSSDGRY